MKPYSETKYTFVEWLAASEVMDGESIEDCMPWAKKYAELVPEALNGHHEGDCTNLACTCVLCNLEHELGRYYKYRFPNKPG